LPGHLPLVAKGLELSIIDEGVVFLIHVERRLVKNGLQNDEIGAIELVSLLDKQVWQ
jgi:hypothetical protein